MPKTPSLFPEAGHLVADALSKVESSGVLSAEELAALRGAVKVETSSRSDLPRLIACWRSEFAKELQVPLAEVPRLTPNEALKLRDLPKRTGGLEAALKLIEAFWPWRRSLEASGAAPAQATPFGLQKHLASVKEFAAKRSRAAVKNDTARRIEAEQKQAAQNPPTPEQVKELIASVTRRKAI